MRVCHVITDLQSGGAETMLWRLLEHRRRSGHLDMVVALGDGGPVADRLAAIKVPVVACGLRHPSVRRLRDALAAVRRFEPELIQGWMYHGNIAAMAISAAATSSSPVVWGIHASIGGGERNRLRTRVLKRISAGLSRRVALTVYCARESGRQHLEFGFDDRRWTVITNGIDAAGFAARAAASDAPVDPWPGPTIGLVAHYRPEKDHASFLRAAAEVRQRLPGVRVVMAGRGISADNQSLARDVAAAGMAGQVVLLGELADAAPLVGALDVNCLSSSSEAFPLSLVEAMACGVPCVSTDVGDASWIIGSAGRVVPPGDPAALAAAICELLTLPPAEREAMERQARRRAHEEFSISRCAEAYEEAHRTAIEAARARGGSGARGATTGGSRTARP